MTYSEKLRDPRWQKKRLDIMDRDGFQCRACQAKDKTLNVHHRVYRKGKSPWEYEDEMLVTLCEDCHKVMEDSIRKVAEMCAFDEEIVGIMTYLGRSENQVNRWTLVEWVNAQKVFNDERSWGSFQDLQSVAIKMINHLTCRLADLSRSVVTEDEE